jgi:hypothetical protein
MQAKQCIRGNRLGRSPGEGQWICPDQSILAAIPGDPDSHDLLIPGGWALGGFFRGPVAGQGLLLGLARLPQMDWRHRFLGG